MAALKRNWMAALDAITRQVSNAIQWQNSCNYAGDSVSKKGFMPGVIQNCKMHELVGLGWFKQLDGAITNQNPSDLQGSIKRAAFWFFEAQAETTHEIQLVKYWSCIECIFSFENNGKTTEKIITGLPAVLLNGPIPFPHESMHKKT